MTSLSFRWLCVCLGLGLLLTGCLEKQLAPIAPCTVSAVGRRIPIANVDKIDLLMVVDNSRSMAEEQEKLHQQLPRLVAVLASGDKEAGQPSKPGYGVQDFPPVKSLRVGVLTTDMGTGSINTCAGLGDDGLLLTKTAEPPPAGCGTNGYGAGQKFVDYSTESPAETPEQFADRVACVALTGALGCGYEQQLEAPLKALTSASSPITFLRGGTGHGEANGFVRQDSLLVVMLITDEEDCSAEDLEVFNLTSKTLVAPVNAADVRCTRFQDKLRPIDRYVNGFLDLRKDQPGLLVFAAVTGIPTNLDSAGFDTILADERMAPNGVYKERTVSTPDGKLVELEPACGEGSADGTATPARRIVQVAKGLAEQGAGVTVKSICAEDYGPALDDVILKIADALRGACLPRKLIPDAAGKVNCSVLETEPAGVHCDDPSLAGRTYVETDKDGREVCRVEQLPAQLSTVAARTDAGWYYEYMGPNDTTSDLAKRCGPDSQRVRFAEGMEPMNGATINLECLEAAHNAASGPIDEGVACAAVGANQVCKPGSTQNGDACPDYALVCDPLSLAWKRSCAVDADCPPAYVCDDTRTLPGESAAAPAICVNPTCQ